MDNQTARDLRIAELVASYEEAVRRGERPSLERLLSENTDIADELREQLSVGEALRSNLCAEPAPAHLQRRIWADLDAARRREAKEPATSKASSAGELLAESRRECNLPVRDLASKLGAAENDIRRIEGDQWGDQDLPLVERICRFLGVSFDQVVALFKGQAPQPSLAFHRRKGGRKRPKP